MLIHDRQSYEEYRDSVFYFIEKLGRFAKLTLAKFTRRI